MGPARDKNKIRLIIISGLSGSGKSVALHTLEDAGYYCIDNLPLTMLGAFGHHLESVEGGEESLYAVGIDARNRPSDLARFPQILQELEELGVDSEILFLNAEDQTLIKRFSETRRRHPLGRRETPLADAIRQERTLLQPILSRADLVIDTTSTTIHQLRALVRERLLRQETELSILFKSFGYKHGIPSDADFVFDVRCLPNPHWEPALRPLTGRDEPVRKFLEEQPGVRRMFDDLSSFLDHWVPFFERENRSYLTIAIGCTGGQHRSVYLAERLAEHFRGSRKNVAVRHRELS